MASLIIYKTSNLPMDLINIIIDYCIKPNKQFTIPRIDLNEFCNGEDSGVFDCDLCGCEDSRIESMCETLGDQSLCYTCKLFTQRESLTNRSNNFKMKYNNIEYCKVIKDWFETLPFRSR